MDDFGQRLLVSHLVRFRASVRDRVRVRVRVSVSPEPPGSPPSNPTRVPWSWHRSSQALPHRTATAQSRLALGWRMQDAQRSVLVAEAHSVRECQAQIRRLLSTYPGVCSQPLVSRAARMSEGHSRSASQYHTPSREDVAHKISLLSREGTVGISGPARRSARCNWHWRHGARLAAAMATAARLRTPQRC